MPSAWLWSLPAPRMRPMVRFRLLLACLLMAALPLQGLAAVSMMLCGGGGGGAAAAQAHAHHATGAPGSPHTADLVQDASIPHDHAGHEAQAGHAGHSHDAVAEDGIATHADHKCGICGAGCHSVAITSASVAVQVSVMPQAPLAPPSPAVHTRTTPVPERPPRA